jgi:hypothetical protein
VLVLEEISDRKSFGRDIGSEELWKRYRIGRVMEERMMGGMQARGLLNILSDLVTRFGDDYTHIQPCSQYGVCVG